MQRLPRIAIEIVNRRQRGDENFVITIKYTCSSALAVSSIHDSCVAYDCVAGPDYLCIYIVPLGDIIYFCGALVRRDL